MIWPITMCSRSIHRTLDLAAIRTAAVDSIVLPRPTDNVARSLHPRRREALRDGGGSGEPHFPIEGEEEIGSANLETFLVSNREVRCDLTLSPPPAWSPGCHVQYGLRGIAALEVRFGGSTDPFRYLRRRGANRDGVARLVAPS